MIYRSYWRTQGNTMIIYIRQNATGPESRQMNVQKYSRNYYCK